jgi:subtilisin family serine protease
VLVETRNTEVTGNELARIGAKRIRSVADGFISVEIPLGHADQIYSREEVSKVHTLKTKHILLERALAAADVANGASRLVAQTGNGVFVAIIDSGFDLSHPMFRDSTGGLRVEALLDQSDNDREYTKRQLEAAWANGRTPGSDAVGHGTHVASIAAGSPYLNWASGVAPDARLLLIKTDFQDLAAGASWAFKKARSSPCVVNISAGHHFGPHDGTDTEEHALEALAQPGRIIVVAAGNERDANIHIGHRFSPGQSEEAVFDVLPPPDNSAAHVILTIWHDKADKFDLVLTTPSGRRLAFPALDWTRNAIEGMVRIDLSRQRYLVNDLIQAQLAISYPAAVMLEPPRRRRWKLTVTCQAASSGRLDGWFHQKGFAEFRPGIMVETARTVGLPATAKGVLTVASYASKNTWQSDLGTQRDNSVVVERSGLSSSRGPTRDNRNPPESSAPGQFITAALAANSQRASAREKIETARRLVTVQGTSTAAPFVTGVVALTLELDPRLTLDRLRTALSRTAVKDQHTSEVYWSPEYGFGKVSATQLIAQPADQPAQLTAVASGPTRAPDSRKRTGRKKQPSGQSVRRKTKMRGRSRARARRRRPA